MTTVIKNIKSEDKDIVAVKFRNYSFDPRKEFLAVKNTFDGFYYTMGFGESYTLDQLKNKDIFTPVFKGETLTLEF